ncbi:hypothetical protein AAGV33_11285 [Flavobacterium sp. FBOR7N2.3]|uniref:DUF4369 domain-containing protein n=1 Tax=Flavobacterium magnesitis TaxID=3138077 RepID=A0ABV4TMD3_9FLAO
MKKYFLILLLFIFSSYSYSQKGKAILILKDGTQINGIGEISGFSSIITVKFKNDTLKYKTYNSKEILGIDIFEKDYKRKFMYRNIEGEKFPRILELISVGDLSLYLRLYDEGSFIKAVFNGAVSQDADFWLSIPRISYFIGKGESNNVKNFYTRGLPFSKSFKNSVKDYFNDCPELIAKLENDGFSKNNVFEVVDFYNRNCYKSTSLAKEENKN